MLTENSIGLVVWVKLEERRFKEKLLVSGW